MVFSTKDRLKMIRPDVQPELWAYIAGTAHSHGVHARAIGGIEDHVHALLDLGSVLGIAKVAQLLKANSSRWMNERSRLRFEWQEGYFACSVSHSQIGTIRNYIANQAQHHRKMNSSQEFDLLLKRHRLSLNTSNSESPQGTA